MPRHRIVIELSTPDIRLAAMHRKCSYGEAHAAALEGVKATAPRGARDVKLMSLADTSDNWILILSWLGPSIGCLEEAAQVLRIMKAAGLPPPKARK